MASYKIPQDVEADDKLIGFLSMKQFIFTVVAAILAFAAFQAARINPVLIIPFIPLILIFGLLGLYQRKDQPVETYLLAVLTFYFKPHKRKWDQDGVMETVNVTAPKKIEQHYTDGLSKTQVVSNLSRLSQLMDTRGWAAKNSDYQTNIVIPGQTRDDRLVGPSETNPNQPSELHASDDMLDEKSNPTAQHFDQLMNQAAQHAHDDALAHMNDPSTISTPHYNPAPTGMHQKVLEPTDAREESTSPEPMTPPTSDAILELANRKDDNLSVETIAKEAQRVKSLDNDEVISLH